MEAYKLLLTKALHQNILKYDKETIHSAALGFVISKMCTCKHASICYCGWQNNALIPGTCNCYLTWQK